MSAKKTPEPMATVVSESCTTYFPDLGLELPAGVPVQVPVNLLERVLAQPGVAQVSPDTEPTC